MKYKDGPIRQCVSCRGLFPKKELLRFVRYKEETALFDDRQKRQGRGYYLCPNQSCFLRAWKNKKTKAFFRDEPTMKHMFKTVSDMLLSSVECTDGLHLSVSDALNNRYKALPSCEFILALEDRDKPEIQMLCTSLKEQGAQVFFLPGEALKGAECLVITKSMPKRLPILRYLRFYERLSSKGQAL